MSARKGVYTVDNHRKTTRFIVDVTGLPLALKQSIWCRYWDYSKDPLVRNDNLEHDNFLSVRTDCDSPGNMQRSSQLHSYLSHLVVKPTWTEKMVYENIGIEFSSTIEVDGVKYVRAPE